MKLHTDQDMENKCVGEQLQERSDDRPEKPNGASGVPVAQVLEDKSPHQTPMGPQLKETTGKVVALCLCTVDGLSGITWLTQHGVRVSQMLIQGPEWARTFVE